MLVYILLVRWRGICMKQGGIEIKEGNHRLSRYRYVCWVTIHWSGKTLWSSKENPIAVAGEWRGFLLH